MSEIFATAPWLLVTTVFIFSLLVGSFLNVVIHRLPIMLERDWMAQAHEMLTGAASQEVAREDVVEPHPPMPPKEVAAETLQAEVDLHLQTEADTPSITFESTPDPGLDQITNAAADTLLSTEPVPLPALEGAQPDETPDDRAPEPYNLIVPRSRCPKCNAEIKAHQNIPVISYLLLGGKCANCRTSISARYPIVELATAILSAAVAWRFGWHWQTLAALFFTWALVALTVIDLDHTILPDAITIPMLWLGLLLSLAWHAKLTAPVPTDPTSAIVGAAAGYLLLWSVYWAFKLATGKEGMGYGDFKLFGALGAWMGWQMLPLILLLSAFTGAVVGIALIVLRGRDRNIPLPFGPYLAAAGWIALMWGPQMVGGYLRYWG